MKVRGLGLALAMIAWLAAPCEAYGSGGFYAVPELQNIVPHDAGPFDEAGRAVAVEGDQIVVGARFADGVTAETGAAYLYRFDGHVWNEQQKLQAWDGQPFDEFGHSVAIQNDIIVVGARKGDSPSVSDSGSAYVYRKYGATWLLEAKLAGSNTNGGEFGYAVAIDGDRVVVGARRDDGVGTGTGAAYVYRYTGGAWSFEQKLMAADGERDDCFGGAVAIDGDTIAVGAYLDWSPLNWAGSVHVFQSDGSQWTQTQKLTASNSSPDDRFGVSVDIDGDWIIVGAYRADTSVLRCDEGLAYMFQYGGSSWVERAILAPPDSGCGYGFGLSVALDDGLAVVGSFMYEFYRDRLGAAYAYRLVGSSWVPEVKFLAGQGQPRDMFGTSVAVAGETVVVGVFQDDASGRDSGSAYIYMGPEWDRYGEGTPGKDGIVPVITAVGVPYLGNKSFQVRLTQAYPSTFGMLLLGFVPTWRDTSGWTLLVDMAGPPAGVPIRIVTSNGGSATVDVPIPNNTYLDGLGLYMQFVVADPFATNRISTTDGLKLSMFHNP